MTNMSNFISASDIVEQTESAGRCRKENAKIAAEKTLEEFNFNQKVQEAASQEMWHLKEWIDCANHDIAIMVCAILKDLGYNVRAQRRAGSKNDEHWGVSVSWSRTNTRDINLEDVAP